MGYGCRRFLGLGVDGRRHRVEHQLGVAAHIANPLCQRLQLLDGDAKLTVINQPCPLIKVLVEERYLFS